MRVGSHGDKPYRSTEADPKLISKNQHDGRPTLSPLTDDDELPADGPAVRERALRVPPLGLHQPAPAQDLQRGTRVCSSATVYNMLMYVQYYIYINILK